MHDVHNLFPNSEMEAATLRQVVENLHRTRLRLYILEHHLREARAPWADVASDLAEELSSSATLLEHLCAEGR